MDDDQLVVNECPFELKKEVDETDFQIKCEEEDELGDCGNYRVSSVSSGTRSSKRAGRSSNKTVKSAAAATKHGLSTEDNSTTKRQKIGPTRSGQRASTPETSASLSSTVTPSYTCKMCGQVFCYLSRFNAHLLVHDNERRFTCRLCDKVYKRASSLIAHMQIHTDFSCDVCRKSFQNRASRDSHVCVKPKTICKAAKKRQHRCPKCAKEFSTEDLLKSHISVHSPAREYKCLKCEKKFPSSILLLEHLKTHKETYTSQQQMNAQVGSKMCDKRSHAPASASSPTKPVQIVQPSHSNIPATVYSPKSISQTTKTDEIQPHRCFNCKKTFDTSVALTAHMSVHLQRAMPYSCRICRKPFEKRSALDAHVLIHTNPTPYSCQQCDKGFKDESSLKVHKIIHHVSTTSTPPVVAATVGRHTCPDCGHASKSSIGLKLHCRSHYAARRYSCPDCSETFTIHKQFLQHCRTHTPDTFLCTECGDNFTSQSDFRRHASTHVEPTFFPCDICGRKFTKRSELKKHLVFHSDDAPYLCADCGKQFKIERLLRQHMVSHSDLRPFACEECGKCFSRIASLRNHVLTHLKSSQETSYLPSN